MRYLLEISSRALPGREADYESWYADVHMGEVLTVPGFLSAERFMRLGMDGQETGEFVAIYEVETDDPAALIQTLFGAAGQMRLTDAIDMATPRYEYLMPKGKLAAV